MPGGPAMTPWYASRYTGLFTEFGALAPRPHDPRVALCSGAATGQASGVGWDDAAAEAACVGEAIERAQARPLPDDQVITSSFAGWPLAEPALPPERWVLFHREQYAQRGFPFRPFMSETACAWVRCRRAGEGTPCWLPAEMVYLNLAPGQEHRIAPGFSTGLACGRTGNPILLRALQEVIERDAILNAWWGRYPLEEYPIDDVLAGLRPDARERVARPNLTYRAYRVVSPFSDHVMMVTLSGEDQEGWCFSVGTACRETARAGWNKALLESIHGRLYVRYLKSRTPLGPWPTSFAEHAVWYSAHPGELAQTTLGRQHPLGDAPFPAGEESAGRLMDRLGLGRPVFFRDLTPPALAAEGLGWHVLRVVVPGLLPLHGHHLLAHLGGQAEYRQPTPHPFP